MTTEHTEDPTDTDQLQQAIEKIVDEDTADLPLIPAPQAEPMTAEPKKPEQKPERKSERKPERKPEQKLERKLERQPDPDSLTTGDAPVHRWFFTLMCMNIPIVGWIYLLYLAFSKRKTDRRNFARAYLFYKLVFLLVSAVILGFLIWIGLDLLDKLLAYMEML